VRSTGGARDLGKTSQTRKAFWQVRRAGASGKNANPFGTRMWPERAGKDRRPPLPLARLIASSSIGFCAKSGTTASRFRNDMARSKWGPYWVKPRGMPVAKLCAMQKLKPLHFLAVAFVALVLASCASQPPAPTTTSNSPIERNNGNGLTSYMH
jgi:hypothetical protein